MDSHNFPEMMWRDPWLGDLVLLNTLICYLELINIENEASATTLLNLYIDFFSKTFSSAKATLLMVVDARDSKRNTKYY